MNFTKIEIYTILALIDDNIREGYYYGNKEQYFKRLDKIKLKIKTLSD